MASKLPTSPYKGTRDFFPSDQKLLNYIKQSWAGTCESFGFEPYNGPILEPLDLYAAKSGEEIVNNQLFSFKDRGDRSVAMRPEMTPTLARMVAHVQNEYPRPFCWYSIPNCFRYERPQKGRLREFWQLNVDIVGGDPLECDIEILCVAAEVLYKFGAKNSDFLIKFNHRGIINGTLNHLGIKVEDQGKVLKLLDKKNKLDPKIFKTEFETVCPGLDIDNVLKILQSNELKEFKSYAPQPVEYCENIVLRLKQCGIEANFDMSVVRGLDYYTGFVFEVFDVLPENMRAMFGGGRYDNLLELFGKPPLSGVGFGMGDVTFLDFLTSHGLLPSSHGIIHALLYTFEDSNLSSIYTVLKDLRNMNLSIERNKSRSKIGKIFEYADKKNINYVMILGKSDQEKGKIKIRNMKTKQELEVGFTAAEISKYISN